MNVRTEQVTPVSNPKVAHSVAEMVLWLLDKTQFRGGKTVQFRDPFSDGVVRIYRDPDGRVHFRTPRVLAASIRLEPTRSKALLATRNIRALEDFLERNPLVLAFLDSNKLKEV